MIRTLFWTFFIAFAPAISGCGDEGDSHGLDERGANTIKTPNNALSAAPTEWQGKEPHLYMMGTIGGYEIDIQLSDLSTAVEGMVPNIGFKREYEKNPAGEIRFTQLEVEIQIVLGGVEREIDFELINTNFDAADLAAEFQIINGINEYDDGVATLEVTGQRSAVEFGMEWEIGDGEEDVEKKAESGTALFTLAEGSKDADGIMRAAATDKLGGYIEIVTEDGHAVVISFSVPPLPNDDEISDGVELSFVDNFYE
jgi:hypothetical protein